jgi:fructose-1,6-bisphosphatase I
MNKAIITLTDHLLAERRQSKHDLALVMHQIENAAKIIGSHVRASGLADILGKTGKTNTFGEEVQKLDEFANNVLVTTLLSGGQVHAIVSEEEKEARFAEKENDGDFLVFFDPLDGSSNIDTNCPIGTIFAIYHKKDGLLQPGKQQLAAGYIIYGSSAMFVYSVGKGVNGFTYDPAIGSFILSHPDIRVPQDSTTYSINEAYTHKFDKEMNDYLRGIKEEKGISLRYVGSMVADVHRTLIKGGIFLHPIQKTRPDGKLRLMIEVNPMAFLVEQAGGLAIGKQERSPLLEIPDHIHARSPIVLGSTDAVKTYLKYTHEK